MLLRSWHVMDAAWEQLKLAGVPIGAAQPRRATPPDSAAIRRAFDTLAGSLDEIPLSDREPLLAWLRAVLRHWPSRTAELVGPAGERVRAWLEAQPLDPGRYLKLRRIAIANLAAQG